MVPMHIFGVHTQEAAPGTYPETVHSLSVWVCVLTTVCVLHFFIQTCSRHTADVRAEVAQCHQAVSEAQHLQEGDGRQGDAAVQVCV